MSQKYLHSIRSHELDAVLEYFPAPMGQPVRVLEIGAGTGHQAQRLTNLGYDVIAIDVPGSAYAHERVHPVTEYDGYTLPVPSRSVDVVFSSNVLEHVLHVDELLAETVRVLAPDGIAIHILPTPSWRWWTSLTHYGRVVSRAIAAISGRQRTKQLGTSERAWSPGAWDIIKSLAWPARHGERGTTLTEAYYFSRKWWFVAFRTAGFETRFTFPVGLFYTGSMLMAERLSLWRRTKMSRWLGSSCRVYVLAPISESVESAIQHQQDCQE